MDKQAVERELPSMRLPKLTDQQVMDCVLIGEDKGAARAEVAIRAMRRGIAIGRAESRTAEQGAVELPAAHQWADDVAINREADGERVWMQPKVARQLVDEYRNAVAAATRAAFEKAAQVCDLHAKHSAHTYAKAAARSLASRIRALADALPAEAPEGRETLRNEAIANTAAQDILIEEMRQITAAMAGIKPNNHQGRLVLESKRNALQHAFNRIGALAASPEAAQPAESERDVELPAHDGLLRRLYDDEHLTASDIKQYAEEYARKHEKNVRAALAQATPQAPEGEIEREASRLQWLRQECNPDNFRKLMNGCPLGTDDAALASKENAE